MEQDPCNAMLNVMSADCSRVFSVKCLAKDYNEAKQVALAQHPNARIMGVTAVFDKVQP